MRHNKQSRLTRKRRGMPWHVIPEHIVLPVLLASMLGGCLSEKSHSTADAAANDGAPNGGAAGGDAALTGTRALCVPDSDPYRTCADFGLHLYVCYVPVPSVPGDDCFAISVTRKDGGQGRCCP
jgi:hypothetical protein